jgi:5'-3' exonuclease
MGIPRYYANIIKEYPEVILSKLDHIDHFMIDFNAMIYQSIPNQAPNQTLIETVIIDMRDLILKANPSKSVYIAMDGPVPMGKIIQQRSRRYKTVLEKSFKAEIKNKLSIITPIIETWSTANISPGTVFMKDMCDAIKKELIELKKMLPISYTFNPDGIPGEGEHKIIDVMRKSTDIDDIYAVSSPDNDLIVLLLSLKLKTYLMKKTDDIYDYMDINQFLNLMHSKYSSQSIDKYRFAEDYKFLTFLCGNDFCKPVPYLKIKERSEVLFTVYNKIFSNIIEEEKGEKGKTEEFHLVNGNKINIPFLQKIIKEVSIIELDLLQKMQKKMHYSRKQIDSSMDGISDISEKYDIMYNNFQHKPFYTKANPFYDKYNYLFNKIDYFAEDYNKKYNEFFFKDDISIVCAEYIRSLQYNLLYYNGFVDYNYCYQYRTAPLFIDLASIDITSVNFIFDINSALNIPLRPFEQLMIILPQQLLFLLPREITTKINRKMLNEYKSNVTVDMVQGEKWIYSEALLPHVTPEHIIKIKLFLESINLGSKDLQRNSLGTIFRC